jgi:PAS domain S-box-containing protein
MSERRHGFFSNSKLASREAFGHVVFARMFLTRANRSRLIASLALAVVVALLGFELRNPEWRPNTTWRPGLLIQRQSYDSLQSLAGVRSEATIQSPVVIVYLDSQSFADQKQNPGQPWPRELHAQLLQRLTKAGARAVVFDIVFATAGPSAAADEALVTAMREHGRVILAAEHTTTTVAPNDRDNWGRLGKVERPYEPFVKAATAWGIASQIIDDDYVVRRYMAGFTSDRQPSLTWAAARVLGLPAATNSESMPDANQCWIRYYGPALTIPHVRYSQTFEPGGVDDGFFRDKIVFIGGRPLVGGLAERKDEFRNPFHSWGYKELFMPGVEVHATEMLNLIRGDWLHRLGQGSEMLLLLAAALLFGGGLLWLRPIPATVVALAGAGLAMGVALAGFAHGVWFPWLIVSGVQIPVALGGSVLFYSVEWYRARQRFEAAKRIADAKIREQAALIDKAHDAILVQDLSGKILYSNPSTERLYGWQPDEWQRADAVQEVFSPDRAAADNARAAALRDGEWNGELRQQTKAGQIVIVASRWTLIRDDAGRPKALLLMNSDITEKKQLEAQFLRTQRLNTIGSLAGGMAHDLNNALAPILMGAQLLRRKATDADSRQLLAMMETSTHRGADMVRQVLLFARGRGGEFERLEIGALVKELEKMVCETFPKNISVESFLPRDLWPVRGNLTQLHQVLLNLCVNARDAMPAGGKLSFVVDNVELGVAEAATIPEGRPGQYLSLLVSDTGTGMPPEVRARIFEPFFSTKGEGRGTGIGLATVLRIVKAHGGFLRVESAPGQGTAFEFFLPRALEAAPVEATQPVTASPRGSGETILVADDEQVIRELVSAELTLAGYHVLTATNGAEAVALFRQHAGEVRLFITDGAMPVMGGERAMAELRQLQPGLPVILTSGEVAADLEPMAGVTVVSKPFALEEILGAVSQSLRRSA